MIWEEYEEIVDLVDLYDTRAKKWGAFFIALLIYLFLAALFLLDLMPFKNPPFLQSPSSESSSHKRSTTPAQVRFYTPPPTQTKNQPLPLTGQIGQDKPPAEQPKKQSILPQTVLQKKQPPPPAESHHPVLPTLTPPENNIPKPAITQQPSEKESSSIPIEAPAEEKHESPLEQQPPQRHSFQSKSTWFKKTAAPPTTIPNQMTHQISDHINQEQALPRTNVTSAFRQFLKRDASTTLYDESTEGVEKKVDESGDRNTGSIPSKTGRPGSQRSVWNKRSAAEQAKHVGEEFFLNQLVYCICDSSHQNPLQLQGERVPFHIITLRITINRNRTVERVTIDTESPAPRINNYLQTIIKNTKLPQLPGDWEGETLTIPLRVRIEVHPHMNEIRLIPASW